MAGLCHLVVLTCGDDVVLMWAILKIKNKNKKAML